MISAIERRLEKPVSCIIRGARLILFLGLTALVLQSSSGCTKKPTAKVRGKVLLADGTPITLGWITFRAIDHDEHPTANGSINGDGTFELTTFSPGDGAVLGRHQALVRVDPPQPRSQSPHRPQTPPSIISAKYASYDTSGLEFTVVEDASQNQFEIKVSR